MSRQPYGMTTPEQRDQADDDHDEAAWQRDRASTARDGRRPRATGAARPRPAPGPAPGPEERSAAGRSDGDGQAAAQPAAQAAEDLAAQLPGGGR